MKETYYFQHDYEPTADPKIQALLHRFGGLGYGLWWRIIEMLHSDESHKIQHKKFIILAIAGQMSTSIETVEEFINFCINDVELLCSDDNYFWSDRVNRNIIKRTDISSKRSYAGKQSAIQRNISLTNAQQVLTSVEQNPTKERKEKEKKEVIPTLNEFLDYAKTQKSYNSNLEHAIQIKYESWVANGWVDGFGNKIERWKGKLISTLPHLKPIEKQVKLNWKGEPCE